MGQLDGKTAIVTGGASGIGAATAELLAREGAAVVVSDLDDAQGAATVARIEAAGGKALFQRHDVTDEAGWPDLIAATERAFGHLDIMVANAGLCIQVPILEMRMADWKRQIEVNMDGVFLSVINAIPAMRRAGGGSIVILSSVAGLRGTPGLAGYCATKGGVRFFAKAVAMECAGAGDNIRVNTVHPGTVDTPIWTKIPAEAEGHEGAAAIDPHELARNTVPLRRPARPEDIAAGILFLASPASAYVTGSEIVIDGGMTGGALPRPQALK